ncbi:MAG: PP2C family protein-serine/threonine phosphatase [Sulfuricellaceae bacterium]
MSDPDSSNRQETPEMIRLSQPNNTIMEWFCNVLWGGNSFVKQSFRIPGMAGCVLSIPHGDDASGGDIYHITVCGHGVFSKFLLVDAMGHGRKAAVLSQALLEPLKCLATELDNRVILGELNRIIQEQAATGNFATAVAATFNSWDSSWTYAYAGHPPMLICRDGHWESLEKPGDRVLPVGIIQGICFQQSMVTLQPGNWLLLYSDALTDIMTAHAKERDTILALCDVLNSIDTDHVETFHAALTGRLIDLNGGTRFGDDLTFIVLRHDTPHAETLTSRWCDPALRKGRKMMMKIMRWLNDIR